MPSWLEHLQDALAPLGITVEREIASGGMGHVALGYDATLDRRIAIKILRPEKATAAAAERFVLEARKAAGLSHPNVVKVHHADERGGLSFYTMDYVDGPTLATVLEAGPVAPAAVARLGRDLLAALDATHARGLIHRDVKPSNIFMTPGRALLGDFGIAYQTDSTDTDLTRTGELVGTPLYMAPEQRLNGPVTPRTDIYSAGLVLYEAVTGRRWWPLTPPDQIDWSGIPEPLRGAIRQATQLDPSRRWTDARAFADALSVAEDALGEDESDGVGKGRVGARGSRVGVVAAIAGAVAALAGAVWFIARTLDPPRQRDLVIVPFETVALADSTLGPRLSGLTRWSLERLTDLTLTPHPRAVRRWRASPLPLGERLVAVTRTTGSRYGAWAAVRPREGRLEARIKVVNDDGRPLHESAVLGDSADLPALGHAIALTITHAIFSRRLRDPGRLGPISLGAQTEFLLGEDAFARDAWLTAERHYIRALEIDSTFVLAAWRVGNARRWMPLRDAPPYPDGLLRLFESRRDSLPEVERYLIEAQFRPSGAPRFERYEAAVAAARDDPYAALLYGDELFHRGPLAGRPLEQAVAWLDHAVEADSTLAPGWEHLTWAYIRLGDATRAAVALASLERWASRRSESEIYLPELLRIAHTARFDGSSGASAALGTLLRDRQVLALAARGAMSFELPAAQVELGAALAAGGGTRDMRASGHIGRGVALFALGRPGAAFAAFDSAAATFSRATEARLQAAEWRVIPAALGTPGIDEAERERGRSTLVAMADDTMTGPRAAWALALDAASRGDTVAAERWASRFRSAAAGGALRLAPLLAGLHHAGRGQWHEALAASAPALAFDSVGYAPDPFLRSALHLLRGAWFERLDRTAEADRSWLWYENLDVSGWPSAEAQPAEVDWALGTEARVRRARVLLGDGHSKSGCALASRARELWADAEPSLARATEEINALLRRCPA